MPRLGTLLYDAAEADAHTLDFVCGQALGALDRLCSVDGALSEFLAFYGSLTEDGKLLRWTSLAPAALARFDEVTGRFLRVLGDRWVSLEGLQVLEYLCRGFAVHQRLAFEMMALALPLHDKPMFVRLCQCLELPASLGWARECQRVGQPLLLKQIVSKTASGFAQLANFALDVVEAAPRFSKTHRFFLHRYIREFLAHGGLRPFSDNVFLLDWVALLARLNGLVLSQDNVSLAELARVATEGLCTKTRLNNALLETLVKQYFAVIEGQPSQYFNAGIVTETLARIVGSQMVPPALLDPAGKPPGEFTRYWLFAEETTLLGVPYFSSLLMTTVMPHLAPIIAEALKALGDAYKRGDSSLHNYFSLLTVLLRSVALANFEADSESATDIDAQFAVDSEKLYADSPLLRAMFVERMLKDTLNFVALLSEGLKARDSSLQSFSDLEFLKGWFATLFKLHNRKALEVIMQQAPDAELGSFVISCLGARGELVREIMNACPSANIGELTAPARSKLIAEVIVKAAASNETMMVKEMTECFVDHLDIMTAGDMKKVADALKTNMPERCRVAILSTLIVRALGSGSSLGQDIAVYGSLSCTSFKALVKAVLKLVDEESLQVLAQLSTNRTTPIDVCAKLIVDRKHYEEPELAVEKLTEACFWPILLLSKHLAHYAQWVLAQPSVLDLKNDSVTSQLVLGRLKEVLGHASHESASLSRRICLFPETVAELKRATLINIASRVECEVDCIEIIVNHLLAEKVNDAAVINVACNVLSREDSPLTLIQKLLAFKLKGHVELFDDVIAIMGPKKVECNVQEMAKALSLTVNVGLLSSETVAASAVKFYLDKTEGSFALLASIAKVLSETARLNHDIEQVIERAVWQLSEVALPPSTGEELITVLGWATDAVHINQGSVALIGFMKFILDVLVTLPGVRLSEALLERCAALPDAVAGESLIPVRGLLFGHSWLKLSSRWLAKQLDASSKLWKKGGNLLEMLIESVGVLGSEEAPEMTQRAAQLMRAARKWFIDQKHRSESAEEQLVTLLAHAMALPKSDQLSFVRNRQTDPLINVALDHIKTSADSNIRQWHFLGQLTNHVDDIAPIRELLEDVIRRTAGTAEFLSHGCIAAVRAYGERLMGEFSATNPLWRLLVGTVVSSKHTDWEAVLGGDIRDLQAAYKELGKVMKAFANVFAKGRKHVLMLALAVEYVVFDHLNTFQAPVVSNKAGAEQFVHHCVCEGILESLKNQELGNVLYACAQGATDARVAEFLVLMGEYATKPKANFARSVRRYVKIDATSADYQYLMLSRFVHGAPAAPKRFVEYVNAVVAAEFPSLPAFKMPLILYVLEASADVFTRFLTTWNRMIATAMLNDVADFIFPPSQVYHSRYHTLLGDHGHGYCLEIIAAGQDIINSSVSDELTATMAAFITLLVVASPFESILITTWIPYLFKLPNEAVHSVCYALATLAVDGAFLTPWTRHLSAHIKTHMLSSLEHAQVKQLMDTSVFSPWEALLGLLMGVGPTLLENQDPGFVEELLQHIMWTPQSLINLQLASGAKMVDLASLWDDIEKANEAESQETHKRQTIRIRRQLGRRLVERVAGVQGSTSDHNPQDDTTATYANILEVYAHTISDLCSKGHLDVMIRACATKLKIALGMVQTDEPSGVVELCNTLHSLAFILGQTPVDKVSGFIDSLISLITLTTTFLGSKFEDRTAASTAPMDLVGDSMLVSYAECFSPTALRLANEADLNALFDIPTSAKQLATLQERAITHAGDLNEHANFVDLERAICRLFCKLLLKCDGPALSKTMLSTILAARCGADTCLGSRVDGKDTLSNKSVYVARVFALMYNQAAQVGGALAISGSVSQTSDDMVSVLKRCNADFEKALIEYETAKATETSKRRRQQRQQRLWFWYEVGMPALMCLGECGHALNEARDVTAEMGTQPFAVSTALMDVLCSAFDGLSLFPRFHACGTFLDNYVAGEGAEYGKAWLCVLRRAVVEVLGLASQEAPILTVAFDKLIEKLMSSEDVRVKLGVARVLQQAWATLTVALLPVLQDTLKAIVHMIDSTDAELQALAKSMAFLIEKVTGETLSGSLAF